MKTAIHGRWNRHSSKIEEARNLWRTREDFDKGKATLEELSKAQDSLTERFLILQDNIGIDVVSDGGFRWDSALDIARKIGGCQGFKTLHRIEETNHFHRAPEVSNTPIWREPILKSDLRFAKNHTTKEIMVSLIGPYTLARQSINLDPTINVSKLALLYADALGNEIRELLAEGVSAVKVNDPYILLYPNDLDLIKDVMRWLTLSLDQNRVFLSTWFYGIDGWKGYFDLPFGGFFLDFAYGNRQVQAENFYALSEFPKNKVLGAGLIDARQPFLETMPNLKYCVSGILKHVDLEKLYLCPNADLTFLPWDISCLKLQQLVSLKKEVEK